ncbi:MAG: hypothetical protein WA877_06730, partial [Legionella sp.]
SYTVLGSQGGSIADLKVSASSIEIKPVQVEIEHTKEKPNVKNEYDDVVSPFHSELSKLDAKAKILRSKGYEEAYQSAMKIHSTLTQAYETLQKDGNRQTFNETCTGIIEKQRPILDKNKGWSEFLVNLAIAIPTLGIGLLIKGAINWAQNKSFFFVHKTASGKIVDEIQDKLDPSPRSHGVNNK